VVCTSESGVGDGDLGSGGYVAVSAEAFLKGEVAKGSPVQWVVYTAGLCSRLGHLRSRVLSLPGCCLQLCQVLKGRRLFKFRNGDRERERERGNGRYPDVKVVPANARGLKTVDVALVGVPSHVIQVDLYVKIVTLVDIWAISLSNSRRERRIGVHFRSPRLEALSGFVAVLLNGSGASPTGRYHSMPGSVVRLAR